jgi:hypothetical protein
MKNQHMTTISKRITTLTFIIYCCINPIFVKGQGCSDAGFCSIGSLKPHETDSASNRKNQIKTGVFYGQASNSIAVYGNYLEYQHKLSGFFSIDLKLSSIAQNGNNISTFGISDALVNISYKPNEKLLFSGGLKVPFDDANKKLNGLSLPMDYQSSLGTIDLIFGIGYSFRRLQLVAGLQQPISQNNNQFISSKYPEESKLRKFQTTNKFERSGDVLLRASYPVRLSNKLKLTPSVLPIYHLANDRFKDEFEKSQEIKGSQGLTLNGNLFIDYDFKKYNTIQFNVGMPFIIREARPDGLSRSFIATLEYRIKF